MAIAGNAIMGLMLLPLATLALGYLERHKAGSGWSGGSE